MIFMPLKVQQTSFFSNYAQVLIPKARVYYLPQQKPIFYYKSKQHITVFHAMESFCTLTFVYFNKTALTTSIKIEFLQATKFSSNIGICNKFPLKNLPTFYLLFKLVVLKF